MPVDQTYPHVDRLADAEGVRFRCPKCLDHTIICWQPNVPAGFPPRPGRWWMSGTSAADLTLANPAKSDSVVLTGGCRAHFFVRGGLVNLLER